MTRITLLCVFIALAHFSALPVWGQNEDARSAVLGFPTPGDRGAGMVWAAGRVWLEAGALLGFQPAGASWICAGIPDGLPAELLSGYLSAMCLEADTEGNLWISNGYGSPLPGSSDTGSALGRYNGLSCHIETLPPELRGPGYPTDLAAGPDGELWVASAKGLACFSGGQSQFFADERVYLWPPMCVDQTGNVWLLASPGNLVEFHDGQFELLPIPIPSDTHLAHEDILVDSRGRVWVAGRAWPREGPVPPDWCGVVLCYDHGEWRWFSGEALGVNYFTSLCEAPDGNLLAGSDKGLFIYDGDRVTHLGSEDGLPFELVRDAIVDPSGSLWLWCVPDSGSSLGALAKFYGERVEVYPIEPHPIGAHGAPKTVDNEGRVWFASDKGFSSLLRGKWELIPSEFSSPVGQVAVSDDGAIWWSELSEWPWPERGIWRYADGAARHFEDEDGLPLDFCWDLDTDSQGVVWAVGSDDGPDRQYICKFDGSRWEGRDDLNGMNEPWCFNYSDMAIDLDDSVWCAVGWVEDAETILGGGACHLKPPEVTYYKAPGTGGYGPRLGAAAVGPDGTKWFLKLHQDPNGIYGGTALLKYDGADWRWIYDYDVFDGGSFSYGSMHGPLYADKLGRLWMSFTAGEPQPGEGLLLYDPKTDSFTRYTTSDGLGSPFVGLLMMDADQNVWVDSHVLEGDGYCAVSILLADGNIELEVTANETHYSAGQTMAASVSWLYRGPSMPADLYVGLQAPGGQIFYVAPQGAEPAFPIFYAAFDGSTEFLKPGPDYTGPGSMPNTPDMKDFAPPALPLPDPPAGQGPTGLALFAYPVPCFANVPLPAYSAIEDFVLLNTTLPETAPTGTYTFHLGITAPSSISNVYRTASTTFEVSSE